MFIIQQIDLTQDFAVNCVLFYTVLSQDPLLANYLDIVLKPLLLVRDMLEAITIKDDLQHNKATILKVNLIHSIVRLLKQLLA